MTRRLLYAAALVVLISAVIVALTLPAEGGVACPEGPGGYLEELAELGNPCEPEPANERIPLRVAIGGGGLVAGLVLAAIGSKQR